jgi:glycosyltransferase involved in cell wall biosynthesis
LIYCPYPLQEAPSQRFRFEQYLHLLEKKEVKITALPFYNQSSWKVLYQDGHRMEKSFHLLLAVIRRFFSLPKAIMANKILIHREILPVGPPLLEWGITIVLRKKIIYDFDDAIWLTDNLNESWLEKNLRWRSKVASICRWSYTISAGNEYLAEYARQFNSRVVVNPTTIDTVKLHNRKHNPQTLPLLKQTQHEGKISIGWTGSHSTLKYLEALYPVLKNLEEEYDNLSFLVIADKPPKLNLKNILFREWSKETEISDLMQIDIGIMPLPNDDWSKGKCGFKALQYLALEIPCLASPVGVNTSIIHHGVNGFLCSSEEEWMKYFKQLIVNPAQRIEMGKAGRKTVEDQYSVASNASNFLSLFE